MCYVFIAFPGSLILQHSGRKEWWNKGGKGRAVETLAMGRPAYPTSNPEASCVLWLCIWLKLHGPKPSSTKHVTWENNFVLLFLTFLLWKFWLMKVFENMKCVTVSHKMLGNEHIVSTLVTKQIIAPFQHSFLHHDKRFIPLGLTLHWKLTRWAQWYLLTFPAVRRWGKKIMSSRSARAL